MNREVVCHADSAEVLRYLGYAGQEIDEVLQERIARIVSECERVSKPSWCYRAFPVVVEEGEIALRGSTLRLPLSGSVETFGRAVGCVVMTCTLGLANELALQRMMAVETTDAVIFDAASSSLVESCADDCERAAGELAVGLGLHPGQRTSPGYGDLPLSLQGSVVRALDAGKALGVSVTEGDLLIPLKSVTAFVGLFEQEADARRTRRSCAGCAAAGSCAFLRSGRHCYRD